MSAPAFTAGPWEAIEDDGDWYIAATDERMPVIVADIEPMFASKTIEANARLIATAPELYEALSIIIANAGLVPDPAMGESTDCYAVPIDDIRAAEAALRKSRGETL